MIKMMKHHIVLLAWAASVASAAADNSLRDRVSDASACSDVSLQDYASRTCDPPEKIAALAIAKCQDKWNEVAARAIGGSAETSPREHARSLKIYSQAMESEYTRIAELKAIDIRTAAGRCGFE